MGLNEQLSGASNRIGDFIGRSMTLYGFTKSWDADDAEYDWTRDGGTTVTCELVQMQDPRVLTDASGADVESDAECILPGSLESTVVPAGVDEAHPSELVDDTTGRTYRILETHLTQTNRLKCWVVEV